MRLGVNWSPRSAWVPLWVHLGSPHSEAPLARHHRLTARAADTISQPAATLPRPRHTTPQTYTPTPTHRTLGVCVASPFSLHIHRTSREPHPPSSSLLPPPSSLPSRLHVLTSVAPLTLAHAPHSHPSPPSVHRQVPARELPERGGRPGRRRRSVHIQINSISVISHDTLPFSQHTDTLCSPSL